MKALLFLMLALAIAGCGVKTDLVSYETWQAEETKATREREAAEKARAEAALKVEQAAATPPPAPPAKKKRKKGP